MENSSKRRADTLEKSPETKKIRVSEDVFDLFGLPRKMQLRIFNFLDLLAWKEARMVSHQWNELLCISAFDSNFALVFKDCRISRQTEPMSIFLKTFSHFPIVKLQECIKIESVDDFLDFCEAIGKGTLSLKLKEHSHTILPLLQKFPMLKTIRCYTGIFNSQDIPKTIKTFILSGLVNSVDGFEVNKVKELLEDPATKIIIKSIRKADSPEKSFIEVDDTVLEIADELGSEEIKILPMNLRELRKIGFSDVTDFFVQNCAGYKKTFVKHFGKMQNLKRVNAWIRLSENPVSGCFFSHEPIINVGVKKLSVCGERTCNDCFVAALKSFPNLKRLRSIAVKYNLELVLNNDFQLESTYILGGDLYLAPLLQSPAESLQKFSNLKYLLLSWIRDEEIDWLALIQKWPKMPKLSFLRLDMLHYKFEICYEFSKLCPNLNYFVSRNGLSIPEIIKLLKIWPNLSSLVLNKLTHKNSKKFIDAIAPLTKILMFQQVECICESDANEELPGIETLTKEYLELQLNRKMPCLRKLVIS